MHCKMAKCIQSYTHCIKSEEQVDIGIRPNCDLLMVHCWIKIWTSITHQQLFWGSFLQSEMWNLFFSVQIWKLESCQGWYEKSWSLSTTDPQETFALCSGSTRYPTRSSTLRPKTIISSVRSHLSLCWLGHAPSTDQNQILSNSLQTNTIKQKK